MSRSPRGTWIEGTRHGRTRAMFRNLLVALVLLAGCDTDLTKHKVAGNMHFNKGEWDKARDAYQKAVDTAPRDPDARVALGNAFFELADYAAARAQYEEALRLSPDFPDGHRG